MKSSFKSLTAGVVFFCLLILLTVVNIFGTYKGMQNHEAMEAAALGREILRGNGLNNMVIYPDQISNSLNNQVPLSLTSHSNTYTAPGHAFLNAAIMAPFDAGNFEKHKVADGHYVYFLDRVLASASLVFLAVSIGICYLLATKLFERKIGWSIALIMLLSSPLWKYVQSCLPQMFLLMIFSIVLYTLYQSFVIFEQTNKTPWLQLILCALLLGLMALTKWLTLWIFIGYLAAILIHFKPRGIVALVSVGIVSLMITPVLIYNYQSFGSPLGEASATIVNSLVKSEELVLRNLDTTRLQVDGFILNTAKIAFSHLSQITSLLGGIIVAPLFFLSLLHVYKRNVINQFKYAVLLMWLPALLGMAIFGGEQLSTAHQLHIIFAPVMTIMGISVVTILWSKLSISRGHSYLENAHLIIIIFISAGAVLTSLPRQISKTFENKGLGLPNAPYYQTKELTNDLHDLVHNAIGDQIPVIYSDQPAATAWYSDVHSIALPLKPTQLDFIENFAKKQGVNPVGIHTSAYSTRHIYENLENAGMMPLVNLPQSIHIVGVPIPTNLSSIGGDIYGTGRPLWKKTAENYPLSTRIQSSKREQFKDFGHHIFHSRKTDEK